MTIFAGNLAGNVTEDDLRELFRAHGEVAFVNVIKGRDHRTSAGYGFVSMPVEKEGEAAIASLHLRVVKGQAINVNEARSRTLQA